MTANRPAGGGAAGVGSRLVFAILYTGILALLVEALRGASPPILIIVTTFNFAAFLYLWRKQFGGILSYVDPAIFFCFVIYIYTVFPLLAFYIYEYQLGATADSRLSSIVIDDVLVADVALCANAALAGFGAAYLALRKPRPIEAPDVPHAAVVAFWTGLGVSMAILLIPVIFGSETAGYAGEYLFYRGLPTLIVQILNINSSLFLVCFFGLMIAYASEGKLLPIAVIAFFCLAYFTVITDARAQLFFVAFALFIARDHFIRRFSSISLAGFAALGLVAFLMLGVIRDGVDGLAYVVGRSEFMAVFVTALDIQQLYVTGSLVNMNVNLLLSDLFRLVPQQLLYFEKVDPALWYVTTFYPVYAEAGGGLAFGLLAESVLGGGVWAALTRGLLLGAVLSFALNYLSARASLWRTIIYFWLFVSLYQSFRDTTFTLIGKFAFQLGPALVFVYILHQLFTVRSRSTALPGRDVLRPASLRKDW